jgi:hypothetical protein
MPLDDVSGRNPGIIRRAVAGDPGRAIQKSFRSLDRRAEGSAIGKSPAFEYPEYLNDCKGFLIKQIEIQKPKLILVLGLHLLGYMSTISAELLAISKIKSYKKMDEQKLASVKSISFIGLDGYQTNIVFITHPTYRHLNIGNRRFRDFKGAQAELELIDQFR